MSGADCMVNVKGKPGKRLGRTPLIITTKMICIVNDNGDKPSI
jgi:hypothetical protein